MSRHRSAIRLVLFQLAVIQLLLGLYALFFPLSFYEDFPLGRGWVELLPAYNEHLIRDLGGLWLGTALVLGAAAVRYEKTLVQVALASFMFFSVPHTTWHLFNLDPYSTGDAIANALTLAVTVLLPGWALWASTRGDELA